MVSLTFLEKKFLSQSEISTFSLILFSKIEKFYRIKERFKVNEIDIPDYQYHLSCNTKKMACLAFLEKKFVFQSEISTFSLIVFSKILKFRRVKESFKSNPTRYRVSPGYVECKTKGTFGIACLGKKFVFQSEISIYSLIVFSKILKFRRVKESFKSNPTRYRVSPGYVECKTKGTFGIACLGKKFVFQSEISIYSLILFSKT